MMSFNAIPMIPTEATVVGNHIANKKRRLIKTIVAMIRVRVIKVQYHRMMLETS